MSADYDPPAPADLDASGRDLILLYADDGVYLSEVLEGLGLPDLAAVRERLKARRLISEPLPQTRSREDVLAQRAGERRRIVEEAREIDAAYAGRPVAWPGPLDTDAEIAAASVAMQREAEGEAGQRTVLVREDYDSLIDLTDAIDASKAAGAPFAIVWRAENAVQYLDPDPAGGWSRRQIPMDEDEIGRGDLLQRALTVLKMAPKVPPLPRSGSSIR